jgi:peptide deformylase
VSALAILEYPDPRLRRAARPVMAFDAALARLVDDLFETMYAVGAIGLAAPQVGEDLQIVVTDVSEDRSFPELFINPSIVSGGVLALVEESCLSLPGLVGKVRRTLRVEIRAQDRRGAPFELRLEDMRAVALQHEMDHLRGVLFLDRLSPWQRLRYRWRGPLRPVAGAGAALSSGSRESHGTVK